MLLFSVFAALWRLIVTITTVASLGVGVPPGLIPTLLPPDVANEIASSGRAGQGERTPDEQAHPRARRGKAANKNTDKSTDKDAGKGRGGRGGGAGKREAPTTPAPASMEPARPGFPITIGAWNVLGASHTEGRGCNRCPLPDSGPRMARTVRAIGRHHLDVLGLQEFQPSQQAMFRQQMPGWAIYANADNAVAWNTRTFAFVDATTFTIPYFGGRPRHMPQVRLKHLSTGREIAVLSVHNPADVRGPARRWREEAVRTEASIANTLTAADVPVFLTGDMNDRAEFFCQITAASTLIASAGGSRDATSCTPPARMDVDWLLGSAPHIKFTSHLSDNSPDVDFASDHPLIVATATVS